MNGLHQSTFKLCNFTNGPIKEGTRKSVKCKSQNEKYEINSIRDNTFIGQAVI